MLTSTRSAVRIALVLTACASFACANASLFDPTGRATSLEDAHKKYTELVRWGEVERASEYVDPEELGDYLDSATAFNGIRFTDFETSNFTFGEDANTATVHVVYHAYSTDTFLEKKISERQEWYRESGRQNTWRVRPDLRKVAAGVTGR